MTMPIPMHDDAMAGNTEDGAPLVAGPFVPVPFEPPTIHTGMSEQELVNACRQWKEEARSARESGSEPRDRVWSENVDLYHGRMDFSDKEDWQHQEVMRDATKHVDRFAASMKRALMQPGDWYAIHDWTPGADILHGLVKRLIDVMLSRCSTTTSGYPAGFPHVFSKLLKMGGVMAAAASVTKDPHSNRIRVDEVDPRELYFDPTGRGLYRIRSREVDAHSLLEMASGVDGSGQPLYFIDRVRELQDMRKERGEIDQQQTTGHMQGARPSMRKTHVVDEFLFRELLNQDGVSVAKNVLVIMGNEQRIIRGPEPNPYWHGKDWIVYQSLLDTFLTVYGRAPMEDFAPMARTFSEFVNLLLDGVTVSMLPNYAMKPSMLEDPSQIDDGIRPFKNWFVNDDAVRASDFAERMDLGRVYPESIEVLRLLKGELREMASQNDIDLGNMPKKSGITATEISTVSQSGSELVMDVAENVDNGMLGPIVELVWWTAIQELDFSDPGLARELGEEIAQMFAIRRTEFQGRNFSFKASAITAISERAMRVAKRLQFLQIVGQSEMLQQEFLKEHSFSAFTADLFRDLGIDAPEYRRTEAEGAPAIPPVDQARIAQEFAAAERHRAGMGTDERRAKAQEQQAEIAAQQAAMQMEQQRMAQEGGDA